MKTTPINRSQQGRPVWRLAGGLLIACLAWPTLHAQESGAPAATPAPAAAEAKPKKPLPPGNPALPRLSDGKLRVIPPPPIPSADGGEPAPPAAPKPMAAEPAPPPAATPEASAAQVEAAPAQPKPKPKAKPKAPARPKVVSPPPAPVAPPAKPGFFEALLKKTPAPETGVAKKASAPPAKPKTPAKKAAPKERAPEPAPKSRTGTVGRTHQVIIAPEGAFLYRSATTTMISMRLGRGEVLQVLETSGDRCLVRTSRGQEGYVKTEALRKATSAEVRRYWQD
jgi:hypothetical protein